MKRSPLLAVAFMAGLSMAGAARAADGFDVVALGALGGIEDGNLSAWLVYPHDDNRAVTFDAGTLVNGLRVADEKGGLDAIKVPAELSLSRVGYVLTDRIKGYLISHAHLDHVAGLVIASPDDSKKPIYVLPSVAAGAERHLLQLAGLAELHRSRQGAAAQEVSADRARTRRRRARCRTPR